MSESSTERARQIERYAALAELTAGEARRLDARGKPVEARVTERRALEAAMKAVLTSMNVAFPDPLPAAAVDALDEAVADVLIGDLESAERNRNRAFDLIAEGNTP
jgi:hypothetical protein